MPIALRIDFDALSVRSAARRSKDGAQARRLLALAAICDGASRTEAARMVVSFRRHTLQPTIPHLTRSSLHRCLQRHGIDRTSRFAFAQLHQKADRPTAVAFLEALIDAVPYDLHTILTNNGIQFADLPRNRDRPTARYRVHRFDQICREHGIENRLTKPNHPWTNGQVERMNRTITDATVKRYHYGSHDELRKHLRLFIEACNHGRRLKMLRGLTPCEYLGRISTEDPARCKINLYRHTTGLNT